MAVVVAVPHVQLDVPHVPAPVRPVIGAVLEQRRTAEPATVSLPLTKVDANRYFLGEMSVGTPGQAMTVTVDITGPLSYVPSVNCSDPFCTSHKHGELTWAPIVLNPEGWAASVESLAVGETSICSENCFVTAISTTPYFFMSMEAAKAVNDALGGFDIGQPGVAGLDCSTLYTLPTLQVKVSGRTLEMSPLEYTFIYPFGGGVEMCLSGFVGLPDFDDNVTVLGSLFMQKFYTAYDMQNIRVGFADSA
ncbi:Cathepsin D [Amphibalanus amphitrite]|uniref:Cathepsin D n=1 Tax=Amphibalanus amphitrite TaxID=1232801 RepID=A0A6A4WWJ6_AMPAM|nr:Cathepsin D [Amphibalanus amphitrite]